MTPIEALNVLDQTSSHFPGNRQAHQTIQEAVKTLQIFIEVKSKEEDKPLENSTGE